MNEIKLRELFDAKLESAEPHLFLLSNFYKRKFFEWFKFGFEASYQQPLTLKQLKDTGFRSGHIVVEPDSKLIFVYSWRSAQQRTMIILADSREEADSIFKTEEPHYLNPSVTQLFVDSGESTIIYNN
ncbi:MAG: hypothetical protein IM526_02260 [Microcystis sp. M38BS1]|uniref:hypothetical protein n=1 Tax=Microcystis sp. M38BS1 TaxID=2771188 RepID=UPI0031FC2EB7|nr:hypothetical protein [Microcystis sp. M38BS1]MCA6582476.1 hypothetical protein [Pseudanabaena sp. M34BS1SP1A06MG]